MVIAVKVLPIISNVFLLPGLFYSIAHWRIYPFSVVYFALTFYGSMMLHTCDFVGTDNCSSDQLEFWRQVDYITAQYGPAYVAIFLYPWTYSYAYTMANLMWFAAHALLLINGVSGWVSMGCAGAFGLYCLCFFYKDYKEKNVFVTLFLGIIGLVFFAFSAPKLYDYLHSLWHAFGEMSEYTIMPARKVPMLLSPNDTTKNFVSS
jgi:hypothetical protein